MQHVSLSTTSSPCSLFSFKAVNVRNVGSVAVDKQHDCTQHKDSGDTHGTVFPTVQDSSR